jgi:hypothetical protein
LLTARKKEREKGCAKKRKKEFALTKGLLCVSHQGLNFRSNKGH